MQEKTPATVQSDPACFRLRQQRLSWPAQFSAINLVLLRTAKGNLSVKRPKIRVLQRRTSLFAFEVRYSRYLHCDMA
jgi:hypothetical protein